MNKQSWIRGLPLFRVEPVIPHSIALKWSENNQLAINSNTQITLLDPKLPNLNESITSNQIIVLESKSLFNITAILTVEIQDKLPIRKFQDLILDLLDEPFTITNSLLELLIIDHQWSPVMSNTKDSLLGILYNSGELLILQRTSLSIDKYEVVFCLFDMLLEQFGYKFESPLIVNTSVYQSLKIRGFSFIGQYLCLINYNNEITIYLIEEDLIPIQTIKTNMEIIKHSWSSIINNVAYLLVVSNKNAIDIYLINMTTWDVNCTQAIKPSRFLNHQNNWFVTNSQELIFISTFTGKLIVIRNWQNYTQNYTNYNTCCGIAVNQIQDKLIIIISLDNGSFESFEFDLISNLFTLSNIDQKLKHFVNKSLKSFQFVNSVKDDEIVKDDDAVATDVEDSINDINLISPVQNSSTNLVEGSFVNYGLSNNNGLITILFKVFQKNALNYVIDSQNEVYLAFIKIEELSSSSENPIIKSEGLHHHHKYESNATSIGYLSNHWLNHYYELPILSDLSQKENIEQFLNYISDAEIYKHKHFNTNVDLHIDPSINFNETLNKNFNENPAIKHLHYAWNFNRIILDSLNETIIVEEIKNFKAKLEAEMKSIENTITKHLIKVILNYIQISQSPINDEFDKFLIIRYYHRLKKLDPTVDYRKHIPEEATINIKTKFFQESFTTNINDKTFDDDLINSNTNHKWSTCKLTSLPLLKLNSRKDELRNFNYIISEPEFGPITKNLLKTIQFCYLTGNKTYTTN